MSCPDCFKGFVRDDKEATGQIVSLDGRKTYVAEPSEGRKPKGVIVIVPDAFGWDFHNNRLLVDEYARKGDFIVYMPDFMDGVAAPIWAMESFEAVSAKGSISAWMAKPYHIMLIIYGVVPFLYRNRLGVSMPKVESFLTHIRTAEAATLPVGVAGFCWGGQHVVRLATDTSTEGKPLVDAFFTAHPSALSFPTDIEGVRKPLSIAVGDNDNQMSVEQLREAEAVLRKNKVEYEAVVYEGASHGFSVRIDRKNPKQAEQSVEAEDQAVKWFTKIFEKP